MAGAGHQKKGQVKKSSCFHLPVYRINTLFVWLLAYVNRIYALHMGVIRFDVPQPIVAWSKVREFFWGWAAFFHLQTGLVICGSSLTLCLLSSPGEAVSCPCFRWDTRTSWSKATGHWPAVVHPEIGAQITSPKPNMQTTTNCIWILSRLWEIEEAHSGSTSSACPFSREKAWVDQPVPLLSVFLTAPQTLKDGKPALQTSYA